MKYFIITILFCTMIDVSTKSIHQFTVNDINGKEVSLSKYEGKVLLIVNTASKCGFTPQLEGMKKIYDEFKDQGFEVLAFPSNDFAGQEPLDGADIQEFCMVKYQAEYPIFEKIQVKGKDAHPLYQFLSNKKLNGNVSSTPKWNFHKYLVGKDGTVRDFYYSITQPDAKKVKKAVKKLLEE